MYIHLSYNNCIIQCISHVHGWEFVQKHNFKHLQLTFKYSLLGFYV